MLPPREYLKIFEDKVEIAPLLYEGNPNSLFVEQVQQGRLEGMTFEGVVCKGMRDARRPVMFKVKNRAWLEKLKAKCQDDVKLFEQLA